MTWNIVEGDCVEAMQGLEPGSVDAVVCDPPYGLEFMGKEWDRFDGGQQARWQGRKTDARFDADGLGAKTLGERLAARPSFGKDSRGLRCRKCGHYKFSGSPCRCDEPEWEIRTGTPPNMAAFQGWCETWASEALRVLKPGGHLLAFGGTRTYHRLACALEDAGFEIRDCLAWLYGSGFPKSLDVSKAIDRRAGARREVVATERRASGNATYDKRPSRPDGLYASDEFDRTSPATDKARRWEGWGTALKPAHEPIVLARKPLSGTVAGNVLAHGTGGLNVDATRIGTDAGWSYPNGSGGSEPHHMERGQPKGNGGDPRTSQGGRWPANVILDEPAAALLDEQTGDIPTRRIESGCVVEEGKGWSRTLENRGPRGYTDSGGASRFFYVAKASRVERNAGLEGFEPKANDWQRPSANLSDPRMDRRQKRELPVNHHPTVKPVSLMRWLVRLVSPPGGLVLDPFAGSGTTGVAAVLEGFRFLGVEREAEYVELARARVGWWLEHGEDALRIVRERELAEAEREQVAASGQLGLLDGVA